MIIRGTNLHTSFYSRLAKYQFDGFRPRTMKDMVIPAPEKGIATVVAPELGNHEVGIGDFESKGIRGWERLLIRTLDAFAPLSDPADPYDSVDEATTELRSLFGDRLRVVANWQDPNGDDTLARLATNGLAAHTLERTESGYVVDLSHLEALPVRDGFAKYGARLNFDDEMRPISIERLGKTYVSGDPGWEAAKLTFRAAIILSATMRDHAVHCHFLSANAFVVATRRQLSPRHPLRVLLHPFQYRTPTINAAALLTLIPKRGIFHRLWGLQWEGLQELYDRSVADYRLETPAEDMTRRGVMGLNGYAYCEDGCDYFDIVERMIAAYLDAVEIEKVPVDDPEIRAFRDDVVSLLPEGANVGELRTREELSRLCSYFIFEASAAHEQFGGAIGDYISRTDFVVPGLRASADLRSMMPTRNTMVQSYMLGVLTNFRVPKITEDFSSFVPKAAEPVIQRWIKDLLEFREVVDERNGKRAQPYFTFHPDYLEISVSI